MKTIKQIITEQRNNPCSLETVHVLFDEYIKNFKITDIPLLVRKKAIKDFKDIYDDCDIANESYFNNQDVKESLKDDIVATNTVVLKLKEKYSMGDYQFKAIHPYKVQIVTVDKIPNYLSVSNSVLFPLVKKNVEIIKEEMDNAGYYLVREHQYHDKDNGCDWILLMFDPKYQEDISKQIRNNCYVLYHFSSLDNKTSIEKRGIIPKNKKRIYTYNNDRVYLITVDPEHEDFKKMLKNTVSNRKRQNKIVSNKFLIYMIKTSKLPSNMKFFYDPHGRNCVYTTETISYNSIINIDEIEI